VPKETEVQTAVKFRDNQGRQTVRIPS